MSPRLLLIPLAALAGLALLMPAARSRRLAEEQRAVDGLRRYPALDGLGPGLVLARPTASAAPGRRAMVVHLALPMRGRSLAALGMSGAPGAYSIIPLWNDVVTRLHPILPPGDPNARRLAAVLAAADGDPTVARLVHETMEGARTVEQALALAPIRKALARETPASRALAERRVRESEGRYVPGLVYDGLEFWEVGGVRLVPGPLTGAGRSDNEVAAILTDPAIRVRG